MVVGNNSILRFNNREIVTRALNEIVRILKKDGEARISPTYFKWDEEHNEVTLVKYGTMTKQDIEDQERTGKLIDKAMFRALKDLEAQGIKFYVGIDRDPETGQIIVQNLILRKDGQIPQINTDNSCFYELRGLNFSESGDQFLIPSEVINLNRTPLDS